MIIWPMTDKRTGNDKSVELGVYMDNFLAVLVFPINAVNGNTMNKSIYKNWFKQRFENAEYRMLVVVNYIIEYMAIYLKHWKLVESAPLPSLVIWN